MYSAARVNQFEMKDTCFEFVINVSQQGNNVKIKYNLKINLQRLQFKFFCEINDNKSRFCFLLSRDIHNPVKEVIRSVSQKYSTIKCSQLFLQKVHLRCFTGLWIRLQLSSLDTSLFSPVLESPCNDVAGL